MGFKFGMLKLAQKRRQYVIDQETGELARVIPCLDSNGFFLRYLDGRKAPLQMNFHMQWYPPPIEDSITVLTKKELRIFTLHQRRKEKAFRLQKYIMEKKRDRILFGESPDINQSLRTEGAFEAEIVS